MSKYYDNIDVRNTLKATNTENVELVGNRMNIDNLATDDLQVDNLDVTNLYSTNISATNQTLTNYTYSNITVQNVSSTDVKVTNLNTGNLTATNITTTFAISQGTTLVGDGTQALPSITFNGDNDTGINRIGEDTIGFSAAGVNRVIVSNNSITLRVPIVNTDTASAATPHYSFEADTDTGVYISDRSSFSTGGTVRTQIGANLVNLNNTKIITGNGTVADPPYTFVTDQNTGIFHGINEDEVGITTNDTQRLLLANFTATANNPLFQEITNVSGSVISNISGSTGFLAYDKDSQPNVSQETGKSLILNKQYSSYVPISGGWTSIAYSPSLNRWVAVNSNTTSGNKLVYSNDGDNWTNDGVTGVPTLLGSNFISSIDWSPTLNVFVFVVAGTTSQGKVYASNNGINWSSVTLTPGINSAQSLPRVRWLPDRNLFMIIYGVNAQTYNIIFTSDLTTTSANIFIEQIAQGISINDVLYIPDFDMFSALVNFGTPRAYYIRNLSRTSGISTVGANIWTPVLSSQIPTAFTGNTLAYSKKLKLLIAVGLHSSNSFAYVVSRNGGVNWTTGNTTLDPTLNWTSVIWIDDIGAFYAVSSAKTSSQQTKVAYSFDGYNWTSSLGLTLSQSVSKDQVTNTVNNWNNVASVQGTTQVWNSVAYSEILNRFVAVSNGVQTLYSDDGGYNWLSGGTLGTSYDYYRIVYQNNYFITTAINSSIIYYSTDGLSWTPSTMPGTTNSWRDIVWLPTYNRYIICQSSGGAGTLSSAFFKSTGLSTWTAVSGPPPLSTAQYSLAYSQELNVLVSANSDGTYPISYSTNGGENWTDVNLPGTSMRDVCWSSELRIFVAVGDGGRVLYSSNGINWLSVGVSITSRSWQKILWISQLKVFIAGVRDTTSTPVLAYSFDGKTFTNSSYVPSGGQVQTYTGLAYSPLYQSIVWVTRNGGTNPRDRLFIANSYNIAWSNAAYSPEQGQLITLCRNATTANTGILHTSPSSLFATPLSAFNNSSTINISSTGQFNYIKGLSTNMGNIMDFYNPYSSDNMFPRYNFDTTTLIVSGGNSKYTGGVLAPNGKIYTCGLNNDNILVIDVYKNTSRTISISTGTNKYLGGVVAPNGKIYFTPSASTNVLIFDPILETIDQSSITGLTGGIFLGVCLAPNGSIYCIPSLGTYVLKINPLTNTTSQIAVTNNGFYGGVLGIDGNIYCPANTSDLANKAKILKIDTSNDTISYITTVLTGDPNDAHSGGAIAPNGNIYFAPTESNQILKLPPPYTTPSTITIPGTSNYQGLYIGAVCGSDGLIYFIPNSATFVTILNPVDDSLNTTSITGLTGTGKYRGGVLSPDGRIFFIAANANNIGILKTGAPTQPPWMLGACFNKF